jgi:hypothetical protein
MGVWGELRSESCTWASSLLCMGVCKVCASAGSGYSLVSVARVSTANLAVFTSEMLSLAAMIYSYSPSLKVCHQFCVCVIEA